MKNLFFTIILSFSIFLGFSQKYKFSEIPDSLKDNAKAVIRFDEKIFTIKSISSAELYVKKAITILDKNGDGFASVIVYYDKIIKANNLKIILYDSNGIIIKKVKKNDIKDYSAVSGYSIYEDNRVKYYK